MLRLYLCHFFSLDTLPNFSTWCVPTHLSRLSLDAPTSKMPLLTWFKASYFSPWLVHQAPAWALGLQLPFSTQSPHGAASSLSKTQILSCHSLLKITSQWNNPSINASRAPPCPQEDIQSLQRERKAWSPLVSSLSSPVSPDCPAHTVHPCHIALISCLRCTLLSRASLSLLILVFLMPIPIFSTCRLPA